jgi:hypothetical protein
MKKYYVVLIILNVLLASISSNVYAGDFDLYNPTEFETISLDELNEGIVSLYEAIADNKYSTVKNLLENQTLDINVQYNELSPVETAFETFKNETREKSQFVDPRILIYLVIKGAVIPPHLEDAMTAAAISFKVHGRFDSGVLSFQTMNLNNFIFNLVAASRTDDPTDKAQKLYDAIFYASPFFAEPIERTEKYDTPYESITRHTHIFGKNPQTLEAIADLKQEVFNTYGTRDTENREEEGFTFVYDTQTNEDEGFVMIDRPKSESDNKNNDIDLSEWEYIEDEIEGEYKWPTSPSWFEKLKNKFSR